VAPTARCRTVTEATRTYRPFRYGVGPLEGSRRVEDPICSMIVAYIGLDGNLSGQPAHIFSMFSDRSECVPERHGLQAPEARRPSSVVKLRVIIPARRRSLGASR